MGTVAQNIKTREDALFTLANKTLPQRRTIFNHKRCLACKLLLVVLETK